jgi:hypothetical protein
MQSTQHHFAHIKQDDQVLVDNNLATKGNWKVGSAVFPKHWPDVAHCKHLTYEDSDWTLLINNEEMTCMVGEVFVQIVNLLINCQLNGIDIHQWQQGKLFPCHLNKPTAIDHT